MTARAPAPPRPGPAGAGGARGAPPRPPRRPRLRRAARGRGRRRRRRVAGGGRAAAHAPHCRGPRPRRESATHYRGPRRRDYISHHPAPLHPRSHPAAAAGGRAPAAQLRRGGRGRRRGRAGAGGDTRRGGRTAIPHRCCPPSRGPSSILRARLQGRGRGDSAARRRCPGDAGVGPAGLGGLRPHGRAPRAGRPPRRAAVRAAPRGASHSTAADGY
jgi:hypothetical protein